jgi:hypothetical protein
VLEQTRPVEGRGGQRGWSLYSLGGILTAAGLYALVHVAARLTASLNLGEDDPLPEILVQQLQLGYLPDRPPLYDWLIWGVQRLTGPGVAGYQLLKYALLVATCGFLFLAARRVMAGDNLWAFLAAESLALIYQISWRFHEGFTYQVGAMALVAATFWAFLRAIDPGRWRDFVMLGVFAGLGLLCAQAYCVFLGTLIIAALFQPALRVRLVTPGGASAAVIALALFAPHLLWLLSEPGRLAAALPDWQFPNAATWGDVGQGIRRAITEPLMYLAPLVFIYPLMFPRMTPQTLREARLRLARDAPDLEQLILHMTLLSMLALILGAVVAGIWKYPTHALMPLFLITTIWLAARARRAAQTNGEIRRFVWLAVIITVVALGGRIANMYVLEPVCQFCRWGIPYAELARAIDRQTPPRADIVVIDNDLGGNLRRFLPDRRIIWAGHPPFDPEPAQAFHVLLWDHRDSDRAALRSFRADFPQLGKEAISQAREIRVSWTGHLWKPDGYRHSVWRFTVLSPQL